MIKKHVLKWQPSKNDVKVDATLDIAVHDRSSGTVTLIVPGVDGSVDGI